MSQLAVITPSYAPDFELCSDLNRSVLRFSPPSVQHHLVVPDRDVDLFRRLAGRRAHVHRVAEFLPRSVIKFPGINGWVNLRRPFPPLRGWITQQLVKLAVAATIDADVALLVDSDIRFIRPFSAETYRELGTVRFYRKPREITKRLPRHMIWHRVARELLGLPRADPPHPDYVCAPAAWDPRIVAGLLGRVTEVTGRSWWTALGSRPHLSEATLYGVFVDEVLGAPANARASADMRCQNHYDEVPLDAAGLTALLSGVRPADVAVMISAKSGTPLALRREAFAAFDREASPLADRAPHPSPPYPSTPIPKPSVPYPPTPTPPQSTPSPP